MLPENDQRKAYLQLMTSFIMEEPKNTLNTARPSATAYNRDRVKYMISQPAQSRIELSASGVQLFTMLKLGMKESKVLRLGNNICLERGYVLINDTCKQLYMHLNKNAQIWVELTQNSIEEEAIVTRKSSIELKSTWRVYHNNILKVSQE